MKALITGASSGIGLEMAKYLDSLGYDLILVSRHIKKCEEVKFKNNIEYLSYDLSNLDEIYKLYEATKDSNVDVVINNAGFGIFGEFTATDADLELAMIDLNIKAVHLLTKLFLIDFKEKNAGYILNVASSAGFQPGPLMATYYATKAYVINLSLAIYEELRRSKSAVYIGCLCPGPVSTNFNQVAGVSFAVKPLTSAYVAKYAVDRMLKKKVMIIPGFNMKIGYYLNRFVPRRLLLKFVYNIQTKKKVSN